MTPNPGAADQMKPLTLTFASCALPGALCAVRRLGQAGPAGHHRLLRQRHGGQRRPSLALAAGQPCTVYSVTQSATQVHPPAAACARFTSCARASTLVESTAHSTFSAVQTLPLPGHCCGEYAGLSNQHALPWKLRPCLESKACPAAGAAGRDGVSQHDGPLRPVETRCPIAALHMKGDNTLCCCCASCVAVCMYAQIIVGHRQNACE